MNNADRIRAMSDEELARFIDDNGSCAPHKECCDHYKCYDCWIDWLKQEVDDG